MKNKPSKGDLWLVDLNPIKGQEQAGIRPVVIISGNAMNQYFSLVLICPLSTRIKNFLGNVVIEPNSRNGLDETSEILTFQIRSISKNRLIKKIGSIKSDQLEEVERSVIDRMKY